MNIYNKVLAIFWCAMAVATMVMAYAAPEAKHELYIVESLLCLVLSQQYMPPNDKASA